MSTPVCVNCGTADNVAARSYDLDLPIIVLCDVCACLLVADYDTYLKVGALRNRRMKRNSTRES